MRYVVKEDQRGYKRRYLVRDEDGDDDATKGIPSGPPDLTDIDFESIKKEINNALADRGLFSWNDINNSQEGLQLICTIVKRHVAGLFKEEQARAKKQSRSSI